MTDYTVAKDWPDTITFDRLHALATRGYRATLGIGRDDSGFSRIDLAHPKVKGSHIPPRLTLWSNGIVATRDLLWPSRDVPRDEGQNPSWQKFIDLTDEETFRHFVESIPLPTIIDLYVLPSVLHLKIFLARLFFGASLCTLIAAIIPLTNPIRDDTKLPEDLGEHPKSSGAPACEVEVTPEMINAGIEVLYKRLSYNELKIFNEEDLRAFSNEMLRCTRRKNS